MNGRSRKKTHRDRKNFMRMEDRILLKPEIINPPKFINDLLKNK